MCFSCYFPVLDATLCISCLLLGQGETSKEMTNMDIFDSAVGKENDASLTQGLVLVRFPVHVSLSDLEAGSKGAL